MLVALASFAVGYICGCFLTANAVMRGRTGKSAFAVGSGNPGMANVGSQLGASWAAVVLAGDIVKTILAIALSAALCSVLSVMPGLAAADAAHLLQPVVAWPWAAGFPHAGTLSTMLSGFGAVVGHDFPFWHRFRGGKGVTATCSAITLLSPLLGGVACLVGLAVVAASRKLDVGALVIPAVFALGALVCRLPGSLVLYGTALLVLSTAVWLRARRQSPR